MLQSILHPVDTKTSQYIISAVSFRIAWQVNEKIDEPNFIFSRVSLGFILILLINVCKTLHGRVLMTKYQQKYVFVAIFFNMLKLVANNILITVCIISGYNITSFMFYDNHTYLTNIIIYMYFIISVSSKHAISAASK